MAQQTLNPPRTKKGTRIDRISAGAPTTWWGAREVPRLAVLPAAAAVVAFVALCNGSFSKAEPPATAPTAQTAAKSTPAP